MKAAPLSSMPTDPPAPSQGPVPFGEDSRLLSPGPLSPHPRPLSPDDILGAAAKRLGAALEALDRAVNLQIERRLELADQDAEYSALQEDRSRLALALDAAQGRIDALQDNQVEAARRVERASAAVRAILSSPPEADESCPPESDDPCPPETDDPRPPETGDA
jgi:hypothetical protein